MARNNFLENLKRAAAKKETPAKAEAEPVEQMTGEELDAALNQARRDLLDAQHQELREREIARVSPTAPQQQGTPDTTLQDVLREKQRGKRRTWR